MEILSLFFTAALGVAVKAFTDWTQANRVAQLQQQLGAMTYDKIAQHDALERAKAAETTRNLLGSLTDDDLAARVRSTNTKIRTATSK